MEAKISYSLQPEVDFFDIGVVTASLRYAFHTKKTYYFQKIVTSPFLGQKLQMTHQNVRKKEGFYPIIITCLLCLLFLRKMATLEKKPAKTAFVNVDLGTLAKFSIYLIISPLEPKKKFQLQENNNFLNLDFSTHWSLHQKIDDLFLCQF